MKKIRITVLLLFISLSSFSQTVTPDWKFYIAFEAGWIMPERDTIFFIWDSNATAGYDTAFGEYPMSMPDSGFRVYIHTGGSDSVKTVALHMSDESIEVNIEAQDEWYPIKLSWDTSMFRSLALPSPVVCAEMWNYFFEQFDPICNVFNMLSDDHVTIPDHLSDDFPISLQIKRYWWCCFDGINEKNNEQCSYLIYPNPVTDYLTIESSQSEIAEIKIITIDGRTIRSINQFQSQNNSISVTFDAAIKTGIYLIEIIDNQNNIYYEKIIKL